MGSGQGKPKVESKGGDSGRKDGGPPGDGSQVVTKKRTMLVLGAAGVGKTTIVKQLTTSLGGGLPKEITTKLTIVLREVCIRRIVDTLKFGLSDDDSVKEQKSKSDFTDMHKVTADDDWLFDKLEELENIVVTESTAEELTEIGADLKTIWEHPLITSLVTKAITSDNEAEMTYLSADRFLPEVVRIFAPEFVLTDSEAMLVRCPTEMIEVTPFTYMEEDWFVKDVGGQIHLRDMWRTAFTGASTVLFIVSLADYDKTAGGNNVMCVSRALFKDICCEDNLSGRPFVLLFNKQDLFLEKLKKTEFSVCPEFKKMSGKKDDESYEEYRDRCCRALFMYYERAYKAAYKEKNPTATDADNVPIEYYNTCATDDTFVENSMNAVFSSITKRLSNMTSGLGF